MKFLDMRMRITSRRFDQAVASRDRVESLCRAAQKFIGKSLNIARVQAREGVFVSLYIVRAYIDVFNYSIVRIIIILCRRLGYRVNLAACQ